MFILNCKGNLLVVDKPLVMGIINVTPDSFYAGSRAMQRDEILRKAESMLEEGATILDIGGQSTRPGAQQPGLWEEQERAVTAIDLIHGKFRDAIISVDTYSAEIAIAAVQAGASMVNDIMAGRGDINMLAAVSDLQVPYIGMHMKGDPASMQSLAVYKNVTAEVLDFFINLKESCRQVGIKDLVIDPGFGFAKNISHNFELLRNLQVFDMLDCPVMVGVSRKSTIYKTLGITPDDALNGTTVLNTIALMNGAMILRVHDVRQAVEAVKLFKAIGE